VITCADNQIRFNCKILRKKRASHRDRESYYSLLDDFGAKDECIDGSCVFSHLLVKRHRQLGYDNRHHPRRAHATPARGSAPRALRRPPPSPPAGHFAHIPHGRREQAASKAAVVASPILCPHLRRRRAVDGCSAAACDDDDGARGADGGAVSAPCAGALGVRRRILSIL
jgi:hypothetical protein